MCLSDPNCNCNKISDVRALRDDEILFGKAHANTVCDDDNTAKARENESKNPCYETYMALGGALAFQMRYYEAIEWFEKAKALRPDDYDARRKCAGRYLSTLRIDDAKEEFSWCAEHASDTLDPKYMLGCCKYYEGDFEGAKELFDECIELAKGNGDMYVASLFWAVACDARTGKRINADMAKFDRDMEIGHHTGYMQSLKLFAGDSLSECDVIPDDDELQKCIFNYGAHLYYLSKGNAILADIFLANTLKLDTYFSAFAYLGAYTEYIAQNGAD